MKLSSMKPLCLLLFQESRLQGGWRKTLLDPDAQEDCRQAFYYEEPLQHATIPFSKSC